MSWNSGRVHHHPQQFGDGFRFRRRIGEFQRDLLFRVGRLAAERLAVQGGEPCGVHILLCVTRWRFCGGGLANVIFTGLAAPWSIHTRKSPACPGVHFVPFFGIVFSREWARQDGRRLQKRV